MRNSTFVKVLLKIIKKTKIRTLIFFVILLSVNSTAWFIFATKVESGIAARVVAWNVSFLTGEDELLEYINFNVDNIYPGMIPFSERIDVTNNGDSVAKLKYMIEKVRILDNIYEVNDTTITSEGLLLSLGSEYPFKIKIGVSNDAISPSESAYFYVNVIWDYESGDDEADTYWGNKAYYFHQDNPELSSIEINLIISAVQANKKD